MRAKLFLLMTAAALAACGSSTGPDEANDNAAPSTSVTAVPDGPGGTPRTTGPAQGPTGFGGPSDGIEPPCLQNLRLASDLLPGPVSCRR